MVSFTKFKSFRDTLSCIHDDMQEMVVQGLKLEPYTAGSGLIDSQTYEYKLSDLDNSLKKQFTGNSPKFVLSSGREIKLSERGSYECEYHLEKDGCPIQKIVAGLAEYGGEIEICLYLVFHEDIDEDFVLKHSDFNRLMA